MANLTKRLTSISPDLRSGLSPGRRLLALVLCAMLTLSSVLPGVALAGEADSEGEGTAAPVEVPVPPDFEPGGEETGLEEVPASAGSEEGGVIETEPEPEPEADFAAPSPEEVTGTVTEAAPSPVEVPEPATSAPEPEPVQQQGPEPASSEPVANQSIIAPKQKPVKRHTASEPAASSEVAPSNEPAEPEAPSPPGPVAATPADLGRNLAGRDIYVVRPGDCLWHIAAKLLPGDAGAEAVAREVGRLWRLNEDRIGTGDPNLIYAGTELRLR